MFNARILIKPQQKFRSHHHTVFTEEVNKIAVSSNDDKRIQTFDKVTTFPYEANAFKLCESEMLSKNKLGEFDEDIDTTKTEDNDISKTEDIDNTKTEDIDNTKTEDKDEDIDNGRNKPVQVFEYIRRQRDKKKMVIGKKDISSGSFGMMIIYQN